MNTWVCFVLVFLISQFVLAQNQLARAVGEYPYVYASPDFNAPILAELERGKSYQISTKKFATYFYKIAVKPGMIGYVSDVEIQLLRGNIPVKGEHGKRLAKAGEKKSKIQNQEESSVKAKPEPPKKPFFASRYRGLIVEQMNYAEDTMSKLRTESLTFFGYRVSGYNTLFSGEISTDTSILLYFGAPKYYEDVTGQPASGWILHTDFTFDTLYPQGKAHMISYGFGPMFKYSHFVTSLKNLTNSYNTDYPMDDMTLGILFRLGIAFRINNVAIKSDVKYYIESQRYFAYNLSALFEF